MLDLRAALTEHPTGAAPVKMRCPEHPDQVMSLAVYPDNLHCFGCGFHLRHLDALAYLLKVTPAEALDHLDDYQGAALLPVAEPEPVFPAVAEAYHRLLMTGARRHRLDYLSDRGLLEDTLRAALIGHTGVAFSIPVFDAMGALQTIRYRRDDAYGDRGPKYFGTPGRNGTYLYPAQWLTALRGAVILVEGELDALRLNQALTYGYVALTVTNGAGQVARALDLLPTAVSHLIVATDQDEAGDKAAEETLRAAREAGIRAVRWAWDPKEGKDISERLNRLGEPAALRDLPA